MSAAREAVLKLDELRGGAGRGLHSVVYLEARSLHADATGSPHGWWNESQAVRDSFYADAEAKVEAELLDQLQSRVAVVLRNHATRNVGLYEVACVCASPSRHYRAEEYRDHLAYHIAQELGAPS